MNRPSFHSKRRAARGMTLLMAIGLIAFIAAAVAVSLRAVTAESALQGEERRKREAHFAAEAGLAEAREATRLMLDSRGATGQSFTGVIGNLGAFVDEPGLPSTSARPWYEVIPWTPYTLAAAPEGAALDSDHTAHGQELNGPDGPILAYPEQLTVRYRVFLVDDEDGDDRTRDANNRVWLVSVGEVAGRTDTQPHRVIIRSLITSGSASTGDCILGDQNGDDNTGGC